MSIWKKISTSDLLHNKNDLDMRKMYRAGAIQENSSYAALEVARMQNRVTVLARLEVGFEEYIEFDCDHYERIPDLKNR